MYCKRSRSTKRRPSRAVLCTASPQFVDVSADLCQNGAIKTVFSPNRSLDDRFDQDNGSMIANSKHIGVTYENQGGATDPREAIARAVQAARAVVAEMNANDHSAATPCSQWSAFDVACHMVGVLDRATVGATGLSIDDMPEVAKIMDLDLLGSLDASSRALQNAWASNSTLDAVIEVPWGSFPGAVVLSVYAADLLVHAWDLAVSIGVELNWPEDDVAASLEMVKAGFPDNAREGMPFGVVIRPEAGATAIEHLAGWAGRDTEKWRNRN
jgi:uncharacterized protein (TIGR03086 family)